MRKLILIPLFLQEDFNNSLQFGSISNFFKRVSIFLFIINVASPKKFDLNFLSQFYSLFIDFRLLIYKRMRQSPLRGSSDPVLSRNDNSNERSRSRSREKREGKKKDQQQINLRKYQQGQKNYEGKGSQQIQGGAKNENSNNDLFSENHLMDFKSELLRSFLRIQQEREEPIDKFVKIVWTYKGKLPYDHNLYEIMKEPTKFIEKLTIEQLRKMIPSAQGHQNLQKAENSNLQDYWRSLIQLIKSKLHKSENKTSESVNNDYEHKILEVISKPLPELLKLQKQIQLILKNQQFGSNQEYWRHVQQRIKIKRSQGKLYQYFKKFKIENQSKINDQENKIAQQINEQPTSPILIPYSGVNPKLIVKDEEQKEKRSKLAQKIFTEEFEKGREKLEINLSLPHNHGLLSTEIVIEKTNTYDQIMKGVIEFEKYKRMEEDEEEFNDWVPCETEGRFRDRKPVYLNRVRVAREGNKYGSVHRYTEENPPPKTIQGYKFNIYYPDLYDKQKTPQYYLSNTDDPNYCIITFKAGPPYKDIAFKILKKEWEFTEKSGFESIFTWGILNLYFNFKKPRFRI